jgi:hypothetical protein
MSPLRVTPRIASPPKNAGESPCFVKMARQHFRNLALQIGDEAGMGSWLAQLPDSLPVRGSASAEASASARYSSVHFHLSAPSQGGNSGKSTNTRGIPPHLWALTPRYLKKGFLSFSYMSREGGGGVGCRGFSQSFRKISVGLGLRAVIGHAVYGQGGHHLPHNGAASVETVAKI